MSRTIEHRIDIETSAAAVWRVLTDTAAYPQWNPFITRLTGVLEPGARLDVVIALPGRPPMRFRPRLLAAVPERELRWIGRVVMPGVFDGEHWFQLEHRGPGRCRFVQGERFSGLLVPAFGSGLPRAATEGFRLMNQALKARAEAAETEETPP